MAVNFLKELDIDNALEDDTTECPKDETSTASLLHFKYPEEENNNMINMKNNNDNDNENDKDKDTDKVPEILMAYSFQM